MKAAISDDDTETPLLSYGKFAGMSYGNASEYT
jgi:hypothetical protein